MRKQLAILVGLLLIAASGYAQTITDDDWFVLLNGEDRIGYMHTTETVDEQGQITTGQDVKIVMARAGTRIEIAVGSSFIETAEGQPIEASSTLNMGGVPIVSRAEFGEKAIKLTAGQNGRTTTTMKKPIEGDWLPPAAMSRYVEAQLAAGAEQIEVRTVDITSGLTTVDMTMQVRGREDVEVYGKVVPAIVWDATVSAMPGITMREYVNEQGESIKSTIALMPGLELTVMQADRELALSELTPAEMMADTFIVPSRKINRPRELVRGVYRLKAKDGRPLPELPTVGVQYTDQADQLFVDMESPRDGEMGQPDQKYLKSSTILNHEDPVVRKAYEMARSTMSQSDPTPMEIASRLRTFVNLTVDTKDLSVGFATASDVARTKQGDCTEHAVYLAALLRAGGIPSRCVSGLVYADQFAGHEGIFGYHMWTQAWIPGDGEQVKGRWIDYDATLPGGVRFDATHIALSVTDLNDGVVGNDMAALLPLLGNLEIEVVETVYGDE